MDRTPVVDAHVHFWDPARLHYPWLDDLPALKRRFSIADFPARPDGSAEAVVFVEANCAAGDPTDEPRFVSEMLAESPAVTGIVAFVDLTDARTRDETLDRVRGFDRVVGVRHNIQGQPNGFSIAPDFVEGVRDVGRRGLTFDLCITARQLDEVEQLVSRCPDTSFVLDHCGKPAIRDDAFSSWARDLERLARQENVACKLSGLLTEARADQRNADAIFPYAEHALRCFGASRMLYGSDWPVVTLAAHVDVWRALVAGFTASWSAHDRLAFYSGNAIRLYNLRAHGNS